jgi:S1-C subfamily serine protease
MAVPATTVKSETATHLLTKEARRDLQLQPGVVYIEVKYKIDLGEYAISCGSSGSGFIYRPDGYIVTNGHVVEFANIKDVTARGALMDDIKGCAKYGVDVYIAEHANDLEENQKKDLRDKLYQIIDIDPGRILHGMEAPVISVSLNNGTTYRGEIKAYSDPITKGGKDIAIIKIDGKNLPTVPIGDSDEIRVGDPIVVIGYPGAGETSKQSSLVATVTNGKVSAVKTDERGTPVIQSEAAINPGNSGGPAFDDAGRVIGIATYKSKEGEEINFFVPVNTATEFIRQAGAEAKSGMFDDLWKQALDAYENKHWAKAHALMGSVLEVMPGELDAIQLQKQAAANFNAETWFARILESFSSVPPVVLAGIGLVLIASLTAGLVLRFSKPKGHPSKGAAPSAVAQERPTIVDRPAALGTLHVVSGPSKGRQYPIPKTGLRIGRDPEACAIVLPGENVGREHAWVMPMDNGEVAVIDRSSANGTYVNSVEAGRIKKVLLKNGDRIFICRENSTEIMYCRN